MHIAEMARNLRLSRPTIKEFMDAECLAAKAPHLKVGSKAGYNDGDGLQLFKHDPEWWQGWKEQEGHA